MGEGEGEREERAAARAATPGRNVQVLYYVPKHKDNLSVGIFPCGETTNRTAPTNTVQINGALGKTNSAWVIRTTKDPRRALLEAQEELATGCSAPQSPMAMIMAVNVAKLKAAITDVSDRGGRE